MERLTSELWKNADLQGICGQELVCAGRCEDCAAVSFFVRAAKYEDSGLTPEQCEVAKTLVEATFAADPAEAERIRELLKADREGRVVVLPCEATPDWQLVRERRRVEFWKRQYEGCIHLKARVGDTLWLTASYYTERLPQPMEARVVRIKIGEGDEITYTTTKGIVRDKNFGKTVFLFREEAEKALEARKR